MPWSPIRMSRVAPLAGTTAILLLLTAAAPSHLLGQDAQYENPLVTYQGAFYHGFALHSSDQNWESTINVTGVRGELGILEFISPWVGVAWGTADPEGCIEETITGQTDCPINPKGWMAQGGLNMRLYTRPFRPRDRDPVRLVPFMGVGAGISFKAEESGRQTGVIYQMGIDFNLGHAFAFRMITMVDRVLWPNSAPILAIGVRVGDL